ncbi:site-2 protease family protein [Alkaliphilus sp. B6464]|uniref:site-2 protease family protein n=1 Tax=Alkaliphilus sp. B6464 TaxID=2731219 RepID=UPI001BA8C2C3|nr:site-2 protease family protein [Alkaliphilus sp. B6464]QUH20496.1 site-2 protease family protein [Alkaliphilus sp. B6464]
MNLFKIFNIEIKISYLIFFILIFSMFFNYFIELLILIIIVLIHELAHCCLCIYYDIEVSEVKLFAFGGVAKFRGDIETDSKREIVIALAGPLSNFILSITLIFIVNIFNIEMNNIIHFCLVANLTIGTFNLIPTLPLDGGRIIRGIIGYYVGIKKATYIVVRLGYIVCILLFGIGIYLTLVYNIEYIFFNMLSIYIFVSNRKEKNRIDFIFVKNLVLKKKSLFSEGIMDAKYVIAMEFIDIKKIFDEFTLEKYHIITVINTKGKVIGSLSESEIIDAIINQDNNITLGYLIDIYKQRLS